ncbi:hypothetical protein [Rhodococcus sp. T2V]|nr:hypothetical protein [Rhodococcus sp. T2V]
MTIPSCSPQVVWAPVETPTSHHGAPYPATHDPVDGVPAGTHTPSRR